MTTRWGPYVGIGGSVLQSGVGARPRGRLPAYSPTSALYRAVVLHTYTTDDPLRTSNGRETTSRLVAVECDVVLVKSMIHLKRVPVMQRNHGLRNLHNVWIPRPCTRVINVDGTTDSSRRLNLTATSLRGVPTDEPPVPFSDLDGDQVLISYVEGDSERPMIVGASTHSRTRRLVVSATGWSETGGGAERGEVGADEFYTGHQGSEFRINEQGDVLIDTVGATTDEDTGNPTADVGQVRIRVKDSRRFTVEMDGLDVLEVWKDGSQVRIDLGEGATERLVLGDAFKSYIDGELAKVNTFWTSKFNTHTHSYLPGPLAAAMTAPPIPLQTDTIAVMPDSTLSDLAKTKKT
jgi:hypothetical protein